MFYRRRKRADEEFRTFRDFGAAGNFRGRVVLRCVDSIPSSNWRRRHPPAISKLSIIQWLTTKNRIKSNAVDPFHSGS